MAKNGGKGRGASGRRVALFFFSRSCFSSLASGSVLDERAHCAVPVMHVEAAIIASELDWRVFLPFLTRVFKDFYRILEVPRNASQEDIKKVGGPICRGTGPVFSRLSLP